MKYRLGWKRFVMAAVLDASELVAASADADVERVCCIVTPSAEPHSNLLVKRCPRPTCQSRAWQAKPPRLESAFSGAVFASISASISLSERLLAAQALSLLGPVFVSFDGFWPLRKSRAPITAKPAFRVLLPEVFPAPLARPCSARIVTVFRCVDSNELVATAGARCGFRRPRSGSATTQGAVRPWFFAKGRRHRTTADGTTFAILGVFSGVSTHFDSLPSKTFLAKSSDQVGDQRIG
jgi:hypothetical protein